MKISIYNNMNLQESIRRILREETEYVKDVRVKISDILKTNRDGQSLDDAIVNVQDGLKSYSEGPPFLLKIGDKYEVLDGFHRIAQKILDGKKYIISDVMIKESNINLQESIRRILREETLKETVRGMVKTHGLRMAAKIIGSLDEVYEILDLKGTKEDMVFLIKSIMENEAKEEFDYCSYKIVPSTQYITLYVFIPKPLPEHQGRWAFDQQVRYQVEELVSMLLSKLGGGLIRGHYIYVYNTGDC